MKYCRKVDLTLFVVHSMSEDEVEKRAAALGLKK
jgi:hypothetical protein